MAPNFNFKTTFLLKPGLIFDQASKLSKASRDAYNPGLWLILQDLLKNWVSEGVPSDINKQALTNKRPISDNETSQKYVTD